MGYTQRMYCHQYHMDGAFMAKFALESNVNNSEASTTKVLQKQTEYKDQNTSTSSCNEKNRTKHTPAKTEYKKGSLEWLKHTFMGNEKVDEDYSDEDYY